MEDECRPFALLGLRLRAGIETVHERELFGVLVDAARESFDRASAFPRRYPRPVGVNAAFAAVTARSTSRSSASGKSASFSRFEGLTDSKLLPPAESTHLPPM